MANGRPDSSRASDRALPLEHPDYPAALRDLGDPPRVVYVRGRVPESRRTVAIVGSRAATAYGRGVAASLARDLSALGYAVVSGLARGIDAAAHESVLEAGGWTVAVLPGGLDAIAPRHHEPLAGRIAAHGGLLTEWAGGPPVARGVFVRRNRLIAALAAVVVVVEADQRSGALSTAAAARRLGRAVLAVPGDVDRPTSRGCLDLLRGGARVCAGAGDVTAVLPPPDDAPLSRVLAALDARACGAETLAARARVTLDEALALLLQLQWAGAAERCPGQRWRKPQSAA